MTQDRDIWSQLVHGIRYLDFRIGFYPTNKEEDNAKVGKSLYNSYKWVYKLMGSVLNFFYSFRSKKQTSE